MNPFLFTSEESVLSLGCGSCSGIAWDSLTALRGSICDYNLQRHFQKSASLLDPPGALALFCFICFGVFNVTQRGIMEKGTLKALPPPAGQQNRALLPSRGPNPVCLSVAQRMHLQLCWVERKITAYDFLCFFWFAKINPLVLVLSSFLYCMVAFIFHGFLDSSGSAVASFFFSLFRVDSSSAWRALQ